MSVDVRQPFAEFLFGCFAEYRSTLPPGSPIGGRIWKEKVAEWHERWHDARKPRKQPKVVSAEAEAIFALFPYKVGKQAALRAIMKVLEKMPGDVLAERVRVYASFVNRWPADALPYRPHPSTWLNEGRYDDDPNTCSRPHMAPEKRVVPEIPEPKGWLDYMKAEYSQWTRLTLDHGEPPLTWARLDRDEKTFVVNAMRP